MYTPIETLLYIFIYGTAIFLIFFIPFSLVIRALGKRTKEMRIEAGNRGFSFTHKGDGSLLASLKDLFLMNCANINYSQERNLLTKREGSTQITLADLGLKSSKYRTDSVTTPVTVLCCKTEDLTLPEFHVIPEHMPDRAGSKSDCGGIDFVGYPNFSKRYVLGGKDEAAVRDLFHRLGIIDLLERKKGLCVEGKGPSLIIYRHVDGTPCIVPTAELDAFIDEGRQIFSLLSE
ncbi:MAG: hypothetical protein JXB09_06925 [Deltaproteobacteria bacterium]|nr:hypothetical protein [Deltaproteobacteria bacterium]